MYSIWARILQGYGPTQAIILTPLFFGVAHLHHAYEFVVHQGYTLSEALMTVSSTLHHFTAHSFQHSLHHVLQHKRSPALLQRALTCLGERSFPGCARNYELHCRCYASSGYPTHLSLLLRAGWLSDGLYDSLWVVCQLFVAQDGAFRCSSVRPRILQLHGLSRLFCSGQAPSRGAAEDAVLDRHCSFCCAAAALEQSYVLQQCAIRAGD